MAGRCVVRGHVRRIRRDGHRISECCLLPAARGLASECDACEFGASTRPERANMCPAVSRAFVEADLRNSAGLRGAELDADLQTAVVRISIQIWSRAARPDRARATAARRGGGEGPAHRAHGVVSLIFGAGYVDGVGRGCGERVIWVEGGLPARRVIVDAAR